MKKLLFCAALLCATYAQALTWEQPNQAGGKIVLTDRACPRAGAEKLFEAYTFEANGNFGAGCWILLDGLVHIVWDGGGRSVFPVRAFTLGAAPSAAPAAPATAKTL